MKFMLVVALLVGGAWYVVKTQLPQPGQGPEAAAGKRAAGSVLQAIDYYKSARQVYPQGLEDMIPEYLSGEPRLPNGVTIEYQRLGPTFKLTFNYKNPLPVHCSFEPKTQWVCEWF